MKRVILLLCIFSWHVVHCQNKGIADSLTNLLKTHQITDDSLLFEINQRLSFHHASAQKALEHANTAYKIALETENPLNKARSLEMIGVNHRILGDKPEGFRASYASLRLYDSLNLPVRQAAVHLQLGEHLTEDNDYQLAIEQFEKSVALYDSSGEDYRLARALVNLGEASRLNGNLDKAIASNTKALTLNDSLDVKIIKAYALGNLGLAYKGKGMKTKAFDFLNQSIEILRDLGDIQSINVYSAELATMLIDQGRTNEGEKLLLQSFYLVKSEKLKKEIRDISATLVNHFVDMGQYDSAYKFQAEYQIYQDSLINYENAKNIEQIKSKYELDQKKDEIGKLELKNELTSTYLWFAIVGVSMLLLLILIVFLAYRSKQESNVRLREKNGIIERQIQEMEMLHKEIHHRVKNNLHLMASIMGLQSKNSSDQEVSSAMLISKSRVEAMTLIHQNLFTQQHHTKINIKEYLLRLSDNLKSIYRDQLDDIFLDVSNINVASDSAIPIGLIVNEAVCNAVKYRGTRFPRLEVSFQSRLEGCELLIKDDGEGFTKRDLIRNDGFGTKLMSTLAKQLGGSLQIESNAAGTSVLVSFENLDVSNTKLHVV